MYAHIVYTDARNMRTATITTTLRTKYRSEEHSTSAATERRKKERECKEHAHIDRPLFAR